jgi:hypothetical protein
MPNAQPKAVMFNFTHLLNWITKSLALLALMSTSSTSAELPRFFVECHALGSAQGDTAKEYGYHMRAHGFPEVVKNGININLDEKNLVLSVDTKPSGQEEASPLYTNLPLVQRNEQPCQDGKCQKVDYEPKNFKGMLIVTYDKDNGGISVKHAIAFGAALWAIAPNQVVESRGGCLFVALP